MTDPVLTGEHERLRPGPAYLAGYEFPTRWRTPRGGFDVGVWVTDDGVVIGSPDWPTVDHRPGGEAVGGHTRTSEPVTREQVDTLASDGAVTFVPWDQVTSATVTEHHLTPHRLHLVLADGTDRTVWRGAPAHAAAITAHPWRELVTRLAEHVADIQLTRATERNRRWYHRLLSPWVIFPVVGLMAVGAGVSLYAVNRLFDAPLERWAAGDYDADDPVAFIFADSAASLPLPYQLAEPRPFWVIDDDTIVVIRRSGRYTSDRCLTLARDGDRLAYRDRHRLPCIDPHTGQELDKDERVRIGDVLAGGDLNEEDA